MHSPSVAPSSLPMAGGIGLRSQHFREVLERLPAIAWFEVHSENFFGAGGEPLRVLEAVRERYPVSLHGVGLSLGSGDELQQASVGDPFFRHLEKLKALTLRIEPAAVSEHLCWSSVGGHYLNDLLPLPYSTAALIAVCERIDYAQAFLGRRLMVENISSYLRFRDAEMNEWDFVAEVVRRTGCGVLLDVNNIHVSACNHGFDPLDYLRAMPADAVGEIHLAGFEMQEDFLVDTHSRPVHDQVWALYAEALRRLGPRPTLIEWDNDIPALDILLAEAGKADRLLAAVEEAKNAHVA